MAGQAHQAAHGLSDRVNARPVGIGAITHETGSRGADDARIYLFYVLKAQSELVQGPGSEVLGEHIKLFRQFQAYVFPFILFKIERQRFLTAVAGGRAAAVAIFEGGHDASKKKARLRNQP